ncbi:MAG: type II secretion system protein GspM [Solirubrobacteraceae bacterium]
MTGRDRTVLIVVVVLAVLGAGWVLIVSPQRKQAESVDAKVSAAQSQLSSAQSQLAAARSAKTQYPAAYSAVVTLGKAVPAGEEVPSLIYQLEQASNTHSVQFNSIVANGSAGGASSGSAAAGLVAKPAGFTQMPFTFVFGGGVFSLEHLFRQLTKFTTHTTSGGLEVSGRLLTIQSVKLAPEAGGASTPGKSGTQNLQGTITASAYVLPASQTLTAGASEASPSSSTTTSGGGSTAPTAPAIAKVTP